MAVGRSEDGGNLLAIAVLADGEHHALSDLLAGFDAIPIEAIGGGLHPEIIVGDHRCTTARRRRSDHPELMREPEDALEMKGNVAFLDQADAAGLGEGCVLAPQCTAGAAP